MITADFRLDDDFVPADNASRSTGAPLSPKTGPQDSAATPTPANQQPTHGRML